MPHIILECSSNILETNFTDLFKDIHQLLTEKLPTDLNHCKSRCIKHHDYLIGNGNPNNAFAHLSIFVLQGRSEALLNEVATLIITKLSSYFKDSLAKLNLDISLGIHDLPSNYLKHLK